MRTNSFCDYFARFDIWSLNIDRADAELLVPKEFPKGIGPIVLNQVRIAFDPADEICLIASRVKISMPNLTIIVRAYRVVTLADMDRNMNVLGQVFNCYIDCFDRDPHFIVARRSQVWFVDLDMLAACLDKFFEIIVQEFGGIEHHARRVIVMLVKPKFRSFDLNDVDHQWLASHLRF